MTKEVLVADVLAYYRPNGWAVRNNDFNQVTWTDAEPITQAEYEAGIELVKAQWAQDEAKAATDKAALLAKLGITADEAKLLLS